uniref:Uncharacterized protein n=1 Tax=Arundo donax TaxID=35708 RepID=A0A0A8YTS4_ARUDO
MRHDHYLVHAILKTRSHYSYHWLPLTESKTECICRK